MRSTKGLKVGAMKMGLAAGVALAAAACAGTNSRQNDLAYIEQPVETIYNDALRSLDRNLWVVAATPVRRSAAPASLFALGPARDAHGVLFPIPRTRL